MEELIKSISNYPEALNFQSISYELISNKKIYLNIPDGNEEEAKNLGARFDRQEQQWYIYLSSDSDISQFESWIEEQLGEKSISPQ